MLWNWFGLGRNSGEPRDRLLFPYRDGTRVRRADPVQIEKVLIDKLGHDWTMVVAGLSAPFAPGLLGDAMDAARTERTTQRESVLAAVDAAFEVHGYTDNDQETGKPSGLDTLERFGLLDGFQRFVYALLEKSRPFVNAQPRASPIPEPPTPPTDSGSTSGASGSPVPNLGT